MILHLLDDEKVSNRKIRNCEYLFPGQNIYVCFVSDINKIRYIDPSQSNVFVYTGTENLELDFTVFSKIIISGLTIDKVEFCNRYIRSASIDCSFVGADLYYLLACKGYRMIAPDTYRVSPLMSLKFIASLIRFRFLKYPIIIRFLRERVSSIYAIEADYILLLKYFRKLSHIKRLEAFAYPIDQVLDDDMLNSYADQDSNNILCGNSASFTNNHPYAFKYLKHLVKSESDIIVPFGYSNTLNTYMASVHDMGKRLFAEHYRPLTSFMPLDEYNKILKSVRIAVFAHWRQEAMGNIIPLLYLGVKVYLSKRNPLFAEFNRLGYRVFCLEEATPESFYEKISFETIAKNRNRVMELNSSERLYKLMHINYGI